jgi:glycosyltransferase involved in cell wall biosynthesis
LNCESTKPHTFLIIDFGASLNHTHHKEAIFAFATLLNSNKIRNQIWIPFGSEIQHESLSIKKILFPGTHPINFQAKNLQTWLSSLHGKFNNHAISTKNFRLSKFLMKLTAVYFYYLLKLKFRDKPISILFPTACPYTFESIVLLEKKRINVNIYVRLTNTAEQRGFNSSIFDLPTFLQVSETFVNVKIRLGIENAVFLKKHKELGDLLTYSSKFPSQPKISRKIDLDQKFVISFLGYPTINKGHEHLLPILESVALQNPDYVWQVHLYENDPLDRYFDFAGVQVIRYRGKITSMEMVKALEASSLICLPYDISAFKFNASAMMYQASDFLVPTITFDGSAFAEDVKTFGNGIAVKNRSEMIKVLNALNTNEIQSWIDGCKRYNDYRNSTNNVFLEIN